MSLKCWPAHCFGATALLQRRRARHPRPELTAVDPPIFSRPACWRALVQMPDSRQMVQWHLSGAHGGLYINTLSTSPATGRLYQGKEEEHMTAYYFEQLRRCDL